MPAISENKVPLELVAPGVPDAVARDALSLAEAVFDESGVTPEQAGRGVFEREAWNRNGFPEDEMPSDEHYRAAAVLDEAQYVAMRCCYGDAVPPCGAALHVVR